jgi:hypothetical protein
VSRQPDREVLAEAEHRHVETLQRVGDGPIRQFGVLLGQQRAHQLARDRDLGGGRFGLNERLAVADAAGVLDAFGIP